MGNLLANRVLQKFNRLPQVWHSVLYLWAIANDARLDCYKRIPSILNCEFSGKSIPEIVLTPSLNFGKPNLVVDWVEEIFQQH